MNILLVSHCDFAGNSALHTLGIARELEALGLHPAICIPANYNTVLDVGKPAFPVWTYADVHARGAHFPNGSGPDLIHVFTPREHVRLFTESVVQRYHVPYVVHFEDNEALILADDLGGGITDQLPSLPIRTVDRLIPPIRTHPIRSRDFVSRAHGVTALIEALLESKPAGIPSTVFWPGFEEMFLGSVATNPTLRLSLGLRADDFVLVYTGNVHYSNVEEIRSLFIAIGLLRRDGLPVVLLKTGWNHVDMSWAGACVKEGGLVDLGFLPRAELPALLSAADALVQPGAPDEFNNYRFPSKLPEYLASGKPVVLPRANIGLHLQDGAEAMLLSRGDATEIVRCVRTLAADADLRDRIGAGGRAFALQNLQWKQNVPKIVSLYKEILGTPATVSVGVIQDTKPEPATISVPKLIAFYLPQFHPIPENDHWWGHGFTEWANVTRAQPSFTGHYQPQLPTELGFYDLRVREVMDRQAGLARDYGIFGFCFYYYWFDGRRVLELPVEEMLRQNRPLFPFCYCWANENWTRRWDGLDNEVLLRQDYSGDWAERFIRDVLPDMRDPRYIRVDGAPMLLVYRVDLLPDAQRTAELWRRIAHTEEGVDLHLAAVQSFGITDPRPYGFDAAVEFPPHTTHVPMNRSDVTGLAEDFDGFLEDFEAVVRQELRKTLPDYSWYRGAMPSWDNTARRGSKAHVLVGSSPEAYERWLRKIVLQTLIRRDADEPLIFINAWNEWAEGTHLEPDDRFGRRWLEATESAVADGLRQYFASRGFAVNRDEAVEHIHANLAAS